MPVPPLPLHVPAVGWSPDLRALRILDQRLLPGAQEVRDLVQLEEIVEAIRAIALGRRYLTPAVAELLAQQLNRKGDAPPHEQLSEREFQVFLKLARGETAGDIAKSLSLSVKTVSTYRTRLMEKMGLSSNSDLTYYALKNRLID